MIGEDGILYRIRHIFCFNEYFVSTDSSSPMIIIVCIVLSYLEIISKTGCIYSCPDEEINGLLIQDRLREMFSKENADNTNHVFSNGQRSEFIYHLLKLIALGGSMCQAEERFGPLKAAVKTMYKELVQVHKDSSDKIHVSSTVYEIEPCSSGVESTIFPVASPFNKCYGIVSNNGMKVTLVYKPFKAFW